MLSLDTLAGLSASVPGIYPFHETTPCGLLFFSFFFLFFFFCSMLFFKRPHPLPGRRRMWSGRVDAHSIHGSRTVRLEEFHPWW